MKLSEACKKELEAAAAREDGRLSPMAWERHRAALMRRGLIDTQSIITDAGREFLRHNAGGMARELAAHDSDNPNDING